MNTNLHLHYYTSWPGILRYSPPAKYLYWAGLAVSVFTSAPGGFGCNENPGIIQGDHRLHIRICHIKPGGNGSEITWIERIGTINIRSARIVHKLHIIFLSTENRVLDGLFMMVENWAGAFKSAACLLTLTSTLSLKLFTSFCHAERLPA